MRRKRIDESFSGVHGVVATSPPCGHAERLFGRPEHAVTEALEHLERWESLPVPILGLGSGAQSVPLPFPS